MVPFIDNLLIVNIQAEGGKAIGEALKTNSSLQHLYLSSTYKYLHSWIDNNIQDEGGKAIGEALKTNSSLQHLYLSCTDK